MKAERERMAIFQEEYDRLKRSLGQGMLSSVYDSLGDASSS